MEAELRRTTTAEVRFDAGSRALYSTDGSNYRQVPIGVVVPRTIDDVVATVAAAASHGAPVLSRGGGTSLAGQCCNVAVVMDFSKYLHHVIRIDAADAAGHGRAGLRAGHSARHRHREHGLTFAPDPSTHNHCTLGGMLGNDSCGIHSLLGAKYGRGLRIADNTHELDILTYDGTRMRVGETSPEELEAIIRAGGRRGEIYAQAQGAPRQVRRRDPHPLPEAATARLGLQPRRSAARERLQRRPGAGRAPRAPASPSSKPRSTWCPTRRPARCSCSATPTSTPACDHLMEILEFKPTALEGIDHLLFEYVKAKGDKTANLALLPDGQGFLMVEFGGDSKDDADDQARRCMDDAEEGKQPAGDEAVRRPATKRR